MSLLAGVAAALEARTARVRRWACGRPDCDGLPHDGAPLPHARAAQLPPDGDWLVWLILAGRGFGKTRAGAEWTREHATFTPCRVALVAATLDDVRDTMIEGESGLLAVLDDADLRGGSRASGWNRSMCELYLANGSKLKGFSSERPDKLRGPQHHYAWCDEPMSWADAHLGPEKDNTTWSNLMLGLRLGDDPRCVVTGTPKNRRLLVGTREQPGILRADGTVVTRGSTYDNLANLAPTFRRQILDRYEGTRTGRQELHAEILDDVEGALWQRAWIDDRRLPAGASRRDMARVVVAVDPAATAHEDSDETGVVVAGVGVDGYGYVLDDRTCRLSPDGWARRVLQAYLDWHADAVVYEKNTGHDMARHTLETAAAQMHREGAATGSVPLRAVNATRNKQTRAEPIAALYEQGRVHHVGGGLDLLEDQLCTWEPESGRSPDRLDALVWALTELMVGGGEAEVVEYRDLRGRGRR